MLLVHDLADDGSPRPSSFPRVALPDFHGRAAEVVTTVATSDPFYDDATIWPDADYPQRFRFREQGAEDGVLMNAETQPEDVLEAIRRSALEGGRPMPVDGEVIQLRTSYEEPSLAAIAAAVDAEGLRISPDLLRRYHLSLKTRGFRDPLRVERQRQDVAYLGLRARGRRRLSSSRRSRRTGRRTRICSATSTRWIGATSTRRSVTSSATRRQELEQAERAGVAPRPFHLVLDEMNLARVEYYFAKFLSAMELRARGEDATIELAPDEHVALPTEPEVHRHGQRRRDDARVRRQGLRPRAADRARNRPRIRSRQHLGDAVYASAVLDVWRAVKDVAPFAFRTLDEIDGLHRRGRAA